ncbi:EF-hand domain-containing protein [Xanthomonas sp. AmX2]|uniref:EF-hand domain-containing protein n=1 Tax=Xanthomonas sp. TaxID=29446 RepID=UPI0019809738|nr:EF-hand domain-containing protein [Xanthomonas sp.]MBN6149508.1 EF-hand domain-containing protein [Xanthomonas sp.]
MILRGRFTPRRKVLLAIVVLLLAWVAYAWHAGIAITQGIEQRDMDWNGDGQVSRSEIAQAFYAVGVSRTEEGPRQCSAFYWRGSGEQIRVDCRTVFAPAADAKK